MQPAERSRCLLLSRLRCGMPLDCIVCLVFCFVCLGFFVFGGCCAHIRLGVLWVGRMRERLQCPSLLTSVGIVVCLPPLVFLQGAGLLVRV